MRQGLRAVAFWVLLVGAGVPALAGPCAVCGKPILFGTIYLMPDKEEDRQKEVCETCHLLNHQCSLCRLPVTAEATALPDGRYLCPRDAQSAVLEADRAKELCTDAKGEMDLLFSQFLTLPDTNVTLTIEDQVQMDELRQAPGFERQCPSLLGYTRSRIVKEGQWKHSIGILGARLAAALKGVCAHEYAHAWLKENLAPDRVIDRDTIEGFCELLAYKLCESLNLTRELQSIRRNGYSRGQIDLFIEAEQSYGLPTIVEWMKHGVDERLNRDDLDRIRRTQEKEARPARPTVLEIPPAPAPTPVPEILTLVGISGTRSNRLALINDRAFAELETGRVRVGGSNVAIQCLQIRAGSALIQVVGSDLPQELRLKVPPADGTPSRSPAGSPSQEQEPNGEHSPIRD